jgi:hypothetical protein
VRHAHTREFLEAQIAILMGGRIAKELFLREMTSGAYGSGDVFFGESAHALVNRRLLPMAKVSQRCWR